MAHYQVIIAYDGTDFCGFQRQANDCRTVQGVVEVALRRIGWRGQSILAAGRTDTGVHASGQVVAFDLDWVHPLAALQAALNANLPPDVAVQAASETPADFHPRYDAVERCYRYRCFCQPVRHPLRERYAWRVWPAVDVERLQQAAACLVGTHDFGAFGTPPRAAGTTIRRVSRAIWWQESDALVFEIRADAFLYHMVRRLVGFQVAIGQGLFLPENLAELLENRTHLLVQRMAPPQGLCLVEVLYAK